MTTGTETIEGIAPLFEGCAKADEMAPPAFDKGTDVTTVVSGRDIVTATDKTGGLLVISASSELAPALACVSGTTAPSSLVVGFAVGCWLARVVESLC